MAARARYIDPAPLGYGAVLRDATGIERIYIPSRVADNAYLGTDYVQRLSALGLARTGAMPLAAR